MHGMCGTFDADLHVQRTIKREELTAILCFLGWIGGPTTAHADNKRKKDWARHWQPDLDAQSLEDKPWRTEELRSLEEALSQLKEWNVERAVRELQGPLLESAVTGFTPRFR